MVATHIVTPYIQNLSFIVKNNKKGLDGKRSDVALVNRVSGWFEPGKMSALVSDGWTVNNRVRTVTSDGWTVTNRVEYTTNTRIIREDGHQPGAEWGLLSFPKGWHQES